MENETYIDDVRLIKGFLYPEEGPFANGEPTGWVRDGVEIDEEGTDREALLGYMACEYFESAGAGLLRYLGPDTEGVEPLFQVEGPAGQEWPVAWQEHPEITPEKFCVAILYPGRIIGWRKTVEEMQAHDPYAAATLDQDGYGAHVNLSTKRTASYAYERKSDGKLDHVYGSKGLTDRANRDGYKLCRGPRS